MTTPIDLRPATVRMAALVEGVPDDALDLATPCSRFTVGDLLDHVGEAARAFRAAAVKQPLAPPPEPSAANLGPDWRARIAADVRALGDAWLDPDAWTGTTGAGGVELPGDVAGIVGLDEMVIHGWDLARATGQPAGYDGPGLDDVLAAVNQFRASGIEGLFGAEVPVPADAPMLGRVLGASGRDPAWQPPASR